MYLTRSEYDRGVNTFSPEGRLFQVSREQAGRRISTLQDSSMAHCCLSLSLPSSLLRWNMRLKLSNWVLQQ